MNTPLTRRRFFAIAALTAAGATAPFLLNRNRPAPLPTTGEPVIWKGIALGSGAELRLFGVDRKEAEILEIGRDTSELQSQCHLVCRLLLEKKK